jgi:hypothetical protein
MILKGQSWLVYTIWAVLVGSFLYELVDENWRMAFVALTTLAATLVPAFVADRYQIRIPVYFVAGMVLFVFATIFLGEALDFYEHIWWWDLVLHGTSAMGFGLVGVILALVLFEGDRYAAPPWAIAAIAFSISLTINSLWEIFEFTMDESFGLNMQKSGLDDTMWDLIAGAGGAIVGAAAGYAFLKGRDKSGLPGLIAEFVARNRAFFRKARPPR